MFNSVRVTTIVEAHALFKVSLFSHTLSGKWFRNVSAHSQYTNRSSNKKKCYYHI